MLRLICFLALCGGAYAIGQVYASVLRERIEVIDDFCALIRRLVSTVRFSSSDIRDGVSVCTSGGAARFAQTLASSESMTDAIERYQAQGKEENTCVKLIRSPIKLAARSSDKNEVVGALLQAEQDLLRYKQQTEETYRGRIRTAPRAALTVGLFLAVLAI